MSEFDNTGPPSARNKLNAQVTPRINNFPEKSNPRWLSNSLQLFDHLITRCFPSWKIGFYLNCGSDGWQFEFYCRTD